MTGQDLINIINNNDLLKYADISKVIEFLLRKQLIKPSTLIDAQYDVMREEQYQTRCHFEDAVISTIQLFGGNYKGKDYENAKTRLFYNTSFSKQFPNMSSPQPLTDEDKKYWSDFFETTYGFRPEEKTKN